MQLAQARQVYNLAAQTTSRFVRGREYTRTPTGWGRFASSSDPLLGWPARRASTGIDPELFGKVRETPQTETTPSTALPPTAVGSSTATGSP